MKDYYKILGVEEDASEEEIRARWIELTKSYHPDRMKTDEADEKIREINEAYEILKDEPSRFHYDFERDLKRSFVKKARSRQAREMSLRKKIGVSSGVFVLLLIIGFILLRPGRVVTPPGPAKETEALQKIDKGSKKVIALQTPVVETDSKTQGEAKAPTEVRKEVRPPQSKEIASLAPQSSPERPAAQVVMKSEITATKEVSKEAAKEIPKLMAEEVPKVPKESAKEPPKEVPKGIPKEIPKEVPKEVSKEAARETPKVIPRETPKEAVKEVPKEIPREPPKDAPKEIAKEVPKEAAKEPPKEAPKEPQKEIPKEVAKEASSETPKVIAREAPKEAVKDVPKEVPKETPKEAAKEPPKEVPKGIAKEPPKEAPKEVAKELPKELAKEVSTVTLHPGERLTTWTKGERTVSSRTSLLAKEEEVKQFFSNYVDRYRRKDVDGFLACFSSRAVQNRTDRSEAIRSFYLKMFDESQDLRYQIEGMKIQISQNRVEVKARFRLDQKLKKDGEEKVSQGDIRWVLVREQGRLKIASLDY